MGKTINQSRRGFLKKASAMGAAGLTIMNSRTALGTEANSALTVGLLGSGGRGSYVAGLMQKDPRARVVALCDIFEDKFEYGKKRIPVENPRTYKDYRDLVASDVDAILIATPVYVHPEHFAGAVAAKKHIFCEKPAGATVAGCLQVLRAGEQADPTKTISVGYQQRYGPLYLEAFRRLQAGEFGPIVLARSDWILSGVARAKPTKTYPPEEEKIRYWGRWREYSGDIIVEQDCHGIDVLNWYIGAHPVRAWGTGGARVRAYGDNLDHLNVTFEYPTKLHAYLTATQAAPSEYWRVSEQFYCMNGVIETAREFTSFFKGRDTVETKKPEHDITIEAVDRFLTGAREGKPENMSKALAESTLTAILGRMAIDRAGEVTWEEMLRAA